MKKHLSLLTSALLLAVAAGSHAQTAVTDPVGYITINLKAAGTLSFISPSLVNKVEFSGVASAAAATTISVSGTPFAADAFNRTSAEEGNYPRYYVEITNGTNEGVWTNITGNTTNSLTVADNLSALITAGTTTIKVRKHVTIGDVFGASNSVNLKSGEELLQADVVKLLNSETKRITDVFYFDDGAGGTAWVDADFTPAVDLPIEPQQGLYVLRRGAATATSFVRVGHVKTGKTLLTSDPGLNIVAVPRAVGTAFTLGTSNLTNSGPLSGRVASGGELKDADSIRIQGDNGALKEYFHYSFEGATQWVDADFEDATNVQLKEGSALILVRRPAGGTFTWSVPKEEIAP